jgi:outer membrane protein assembly factor BamB
MKRSWLQLAVFGGLCLGTEAEDWPQWGGRDSGRNMFSAERGLPADFHVQLVPGSTDSYDLKKCRHVKWIAKLGSLSLASPCIAGGKVFIGTNNEPPRDPRDQGDRSILLCLDERTGDFLWQLVVPKLAAGKANDWESLGITSTPVIDGERVYIATTRCEVLCLTTSGLAAGNVGPFKEEGQYIGGPGKPGVQTSSKDADIVWRYDMIDALGVFPHNSTRSHILQIGERLYVTTCNGVDWTHQNIPSPNSPSLIVLDKRTGKLVAEDDGDISRNTFHGQWSAPSGGKAGGQQLIFYGGGDGFCYAFDSEPKAREDGFVLPVVWSVDCNPVSHRFQIKENEVLAPFKYPAADGPSEIIGTPVFWNDRVYVAVGQDPEHGEGVGNLVCIDASEKRRFGGRILWNISEINRSLSTPGITPEGLLFIADFSGFLYCISAWNAEVYWKHDLTAHVWASPLVADGKVYIGDEDGDFLIFAAAKEKRLLKEVNLSAPINTSAVAANGVVYINSNTHLFALRARND